MAYGVVAPLRRHVIISPQLIENIGINENRLALPFAHPLTDQY